MPLLVLIYGTKGDSVVDSGTCSLFCLLWTALLSHVRVPTLCRLTASEHTHPGFLGPQGKAGEFGVGQGLDIFDSNDVTTAELR